MNTQAKRSLRKQRAAQQKRPPVFAILLGVGLLAVVALVIFGLSRQAAPIEGVEQFTVAQGHQQGALLYEQLPPVGGVHNPVWLNCGIYNQPVENEKAVHSMEHGAIWITYQPDLPAAEVEKLKDITRGSTYRLLSPYPNLPNPVVASAWGYQIKLQGADDPRLMTFIERYEQNPRGPEPGAPCTGGEGSPE